MDHEKALDLSMPKLQRATSQEHTSAHSQLLNTVEVNTPLCMSGQTPLENGSTDGCRAHDSDGTHSSETYTEIEDYIPTSKRRKFSPDLLDANNQPTAYLNRDTDENEAYLSDDTEQHSVPFLDIKKQDVGLIKRNCQGVSVCLHDENLWRAFASFGTEMIINRSGRRMFPHIILSVEGLNPRILYSVLLEIVPADQRRYKFIHNQWMPMGMADPGPGIQAVTHPDSPNTGSYWTQNRASFSKVRLTNNKETNVKKCSDGNILLLSMHKYKVVIKIKEENTSTKSELSFEFDESAFVAVTAYQNSQITQLKIQNNPFAKAFRDCHNPSSSQKSISPRRRDLNRRDYAVTPALPPTISGPIGEFQKPESWPFPYPSLPFQQSGINMTAFDQLCRDTSGGNPAYPYQYLPWAAMGQQWAYPVWMKETQGLMNSMYSKTLAALTPEVGCMRLPVDLRRSPDYTDTEGQKKTSSQLDSV